MIRIVSLKTVCFIVIFMFSFTTPPGKAQEAEHFFGQAYKKIEAMLIGTDSISFKDAVFLVEDAYFEIKLDKVTLDDILWLYASISRGIVESNNINYSERDNDIALSQCAVFLLMTDSVPIYYKDSIVTHYPFSYNYEDFAGQKDWTNMFVSTLVQTKKGNCHSLPYLYKMIMDELGYESHLALAPNHIYIKANNKKVGWYNIELTCADFPTDAWYAASGYIHTDAIRNGIYMRGLSDKEAVAMTLVDLAQGYQAKFGKKDGNFIIKCCDTALEHFPKYINAMLLKAEILTELYRESNDKELFSQMTELYTRIHKLGYRKMPQQMYTNWVNSLSTEDRNQGIKAIMNPSTIIK